MGFFAIPYAILFYPILYVVFSRLWALTHTHGHVTAADFVRDRFDSRMLALAIAATGVVHALHRAATRRHGGSDRCARLPYGGITGHLPLILAFLILAAFTYKSGLRARL